MNSTINGVEKVTIPLLGICQVIKRGDTFTEVTRFKTVNIDCDRSMGFKKETYFIANEYIRKHL